ncbi:MAG: hypothetical protein RIS75_1209, partial [Actinomycetota bacterium]
MRSIAVWALTFTLVLASPTAVFANEESNRLGVITPNLLLLPDKNGKVQAKVSFQISGDQPASILMDVVDVISFEDGRKQVLPVGTTPNSIGN